MFRSKTVFVVGAGGSKEVGFPLGDELKDQIAGLVNIRYDMSYARQSGDDAIVAAIMHHCQQNNEDRNSHFGAGRYTASALPLAISIDNFLEAHASDKYITFCGKLGISRAILKAERGSSLALSSPHEQMDFYRLRSAWLVQLSQYLTEGVSKENVSSLFENLSFIIFNYDRNIEWFLWHALQRYYQLSTSAVEGLLSKVKFHHPYGTVGRLPWQLGSGPQVEYGSDLSPEVLLRVAAGIQTFSEQVDDKRHAVMLDDLGQAQTVVYLGFSFIEQNMKLLKLKNRGVAQRIFATALGLSKSDCDVVTEKLMDLLEAPERKAVDLQNTLKAYDLFREYSKSITQSHAR